MVAVEPHNERIVRNLCRQLSHCQASDTKWNLNIFGLSHWSQNSARISMAGRKIFTKILHFGWWQNNFENCLNWLNKQKVENNHLHGSTPTLDHSEILDSSPYDLNFWLDEYKIEQTILYRREMKRWCFHVKRDNSNMMLNIFYDEIFSSGNVMVARWGWIVSIRYFSSVSTESSLSCVHRS